MTEDELTKRKIRKAISGKMLVSLSIHYKRSQCCYIERFEDGVVHFISYDHLERGSCTFSEVHDVSKLTKSDIILTD